MSRDQGLGAPALERSDESRKNAACDDVFRVRRRRSRRSPVLPLVRAAGRGAQRGIEPKLATVLFADLVGSTALADSEDPERTRALLDRFYEAMSAEIGETGGTVEKFAGDAVMAVFGAPAAQEDHAERALKAAFSMRRRLEELFGTRFRLRVGINTGEIVVGQPRVGSSFASGDAVNVAARLEQAAAPGEILVAERAAAAVRGTFEFDEPHTVPAKGKPEGLVCRRLVRTLSPSRPRGGTVPPWRSRIVRSSAWYLAMSSRSTSGSVRSPIAVEPTRSQKRTVTVFRTPAETSAATAAPQLPQ